MVSKCRTVVTFRVLGVLDLTGGAKQTHPSFGQCEKCAHFIHTRYLAVLCVAYQEIRGGVANLGGPPQGLSLCKQIHGTSLRFFYELQQQISHRFRYRTQTSHRRDQRNTHQWLAEFSLQSVVHGLYNDDSRVCPTSNRRM